MLHWAADSLTLQPALPNGRELQGPIVQVWAADLDERCFDNLDTLLSPDEQLRAARFRFERDRRRYSVGRALLRILLGAYQDVPAGSIEFSYGQAGKPALRSGGPVLHFNIAHTGQFALFAFTRVAEIGVDIEHIRVVDELDSISDRYFSPQESAVMRALAPEKRVEAFFRVWTRKEAIVKAVGDGLSRALDQFAVGLNDENPVPVEWLLDDPAIRSDWHLRHLPLRAGYVGAVALRHATAEIQLRQASAETMAAAALRRDSVA